MKNYPQSTLKCPECHTNKHSLYDPERNETFCTQCGLILQDNTIQGALTDYHQDKYKEKYIRSIWYKIRIYKGEEKNNRV